MNQRKTNDVATLAGAWSTALCFTLLFGVCLTVGCTEAPGDDPAAGATSPQASAEPAVDDCCGWWCTAHAVPEEECSLCSDKVAAQFKEDGDWCAEHDRAESQCFVCNPELEAKFAARYEAKFGEAPPKPES
ncbi:MAG: RND transporter [Thermoguttaceae bacterium]